MLSSKSFSILFKVYIIIIFIVALSFGACTYVVLTKLEKSGLKSVVSEIWGGSNKTNVIP